MRINHLATVAIAVALAVPSQTVFAQEQGYTEEVVVTGIRGSLRQSLDVKRDASQIVDAVSAEDVAKFPDTNVAEALQRITGVAIDRSGGEGQFITVRGLGPEFNTVLLNGRTVATDNDGREFSFDVLASDIIQRAEVYKTSSADLRSGGIGATVNVVTARPLDRAPGRHITFSAAGLYDDLAEETSPELTGVFSWSNEDRNFGVLLGGSFSDRESQEDSSFTNGFSLRSGDDFVNAPEGSSGLDATAIQQLPDGARVQQQVVHSRDVQERERTSFNAALQFRPSDRVEITLDALDSTFDIESLATQFSGFFSPPFIDPVIDANGTVVSFSRPSVDFNARNPIIGPTIGLSQNDNVITSNNREAETSIYGANLVFDVSENFTIEADVSMSEAERNETNPFVVIGALAPASPLIELPNRSGISTITNLVGTTDTSIQRLHFVNVDRQNLEDEVSEAKLEAEWRFEDRALKAIKGGFAYSDRTKELQVFNNFSPTQGGNIFCAYCGYNVAADPTILTPFSFSGFLSGVSGANQVPDQILQFSLADAFRILNLDDNINNPARSPGADPADFAADAADLIARRNAAGGSVFGFYEPELNPGAGFEVDEEVMSFWINTEWGGEIGGMPWTANIGVRFADTETTSTGVDQPVIEFRESPGDTQLLIDFGPSSPVSIDNDYNNVLPTLNFKLETSENSVVRFAYSETVTRPTLTALGVNNTFGGRSNAPISGGGNPFLEAFESTNLDASFEYYFEDVGFIGITLFYKDFENFLESATLPVPRPIVFPAGNGGRTMDETEIVNFQDTRDRNGEEGTIEGFEFAAQTIFTTLPGFWSNLGAGVNFTYVSSDIDRAVGSGAVDCDYNGLSPRSYNVNGFYEDDRLQVRLAYNFREEFLFECFSDFSEPREREDFGQLDLSAAYFINDNVQLFFEAINITEEESRDFSRFRNRFLTYSDTGARYLLGARVSL